MTREQQFRERVRVYRAANPDIDWFLADWCPSYTGGTTPWLQPTDIDGLRYYELTVYGRSVIERRPPGRPPLTDAERAVRARRNVSKYASDGANAHGKEWLREVIGDMLDMLETMK